MNAGAALPHIETVSYAINRNNAPQLHLAVAEFETKIIRGEAAARAALALKSQGFYPNVICAHPSWGEVLFLKDVWPQARLLSFCELHYAINSPDAHFDPEFPQPPLDLTAKLLAKNANSLLALEAMDWGVSPTAWQRQQFPAWARPRISVIHDGIDTALASPNPHTRLRLADLGIELAPGDEVVTFVNRTLEPYRGYHSFMRCLPSLLRQRPNARILIIGREGAAYGAQPPAGKSWKHIFLDEVASEIDPARVHFLGNIPYDAFLRVLQVSAVHVYLTYPFVLSWSLLEAMSSGCLIVGSRTPPLEEVIEHGKNGLLVDFFDRAALADTVAQALAHPADYAQLRTQARADVIARYDLRSVCLPQHIALVESLAQGELADAGA